MHMCTYVPPDSTVVLAMRIDESTHPIYLNFPADTHHSLETVRGSYVVVSVDQPVSWGWWDEDYFESKFTMTTVLDGPFKLYHATPK